MPRYLRSLALAGLLVLLQTAAPVAAPAADDGTFYIVRFEHRITDSARASLTATGARVIGYEPTDSYVVWASSGQAARVAALDEVADVTAVSVDRKLAALSPSGLAVAYVEAGVYGPALQRTLPQLALLGEVARRFPARSDELIVTVGLTMPSALAARLAEHPAVLWVGESSLRALPEDEATAQIQAGALTPARTPVPGYREWLRSKNLDGAGVKVAIVDSGVTRNHSDLEGRLTQINYAAAVYDGLDPNGHGSHVAGIAAGAPNAVNANLRDLEGMEYGLGVAPAAHVVAQNYLESGLPSGGFPRITSDALAAGANMWNASWFTRGKARGGYVANAGLMDALARDGNFQTEKIEPFLLVFSVGNEGADGPTQPKEAKNIIAVCSTDSGRDLLSRRAASSADRVSSFSSIGPALDGRIVPTICAPGGLVTSIMAPEGVGLVGAGIPVPLGAGQYVALSGTSMAAPHVTGAAALLHQWWQREHGVLPSPAMVKAMFVNGAEDMGTADVPNKREGWGRVNLSNVFSDVPLVTLDQSVVLGAAGERHQTEVDVTDTSRPLRVTVAWTDAPATVGANPALVNDLDVVVERLDGDGAVADRWLGNVFVKGASVQGGQADRLNNLENVFLPTPEAGRYRITVEAANVPDDGVLGNEDLTDQNFTLVVRNAVAV